VRKALRAQEAPQGKSSRYEKHLELIRELIARCRGNLVRVQECLEEEHGIQIPYPTLTWLVRHHQLKGPGKKRSGRYILEPGEEMQHDTSLFKIHLGNKRHNLQCASLILGYSRVLYTRFFPRFTRFEAKVFLSWAFEFMQGVCPRCVIDNTSVIVGQDSGPNAVIAPEMEAFARMYQVRFVPHRINDANRKGRIERPYDYIDKNFLAGRTFNDLTDLNNQALQWCRQKANSRIKRSLGMSPQQAYLQEKPYLTPLPVHTPEVYRLQYRVVDSEGYIQLESNRYSVPESLLGQKVEVYMFWDRVEVVAGHKKVAKHQRVLESRQARVTDPAHHSPITRKSTGPCKEETLLTGHSPDLDTYVAEIKKRSRGRGAQPLRRLLKLKRTYPREPFSKALERALHYNMYDLNRLEDLILKFTAGDFFDL